MYKALSLEDRQKYKKALKAKLNIEPPKFELGFKGTVRKGVQVQNLVNPLSLEEEIKLEVVSVEG